MKQAEAYLRAVRRGLADAPAEDRERLMKRITDAVSAYLEEDPAASEPDIIRAFGTPERCAAELMAECDPARVAAVRRKRRLYIILAAAAAAAAAALLLLSLRGGSTGTLLADNLSHAGHFGHGWGHH